MSNGNRKPLNQYVWPVLGFVLAVHISLYILSIVIMPRTKIPDARFSLLDGSTLDLRDLRGRPVLVNFWATTCKTCVEDIPHFKLLYEQMAQTNLEIVSVAMPYDVPVAVIAYAQKQNIPYRVALDINGEVLTGFDNVKVTPTTFLLNTKGEVQHKYVGKIDWSALKKNIEAIATKPTGSS